VTSDAVPAVAGDGVVIRVLKTGGSIQSLWNDGQKDHAILWARFLVGRGWHVAVVDAATLDPTAPAEAHRKAALPVERLGLPGEEETPWSEATP
jgi:hypothetical protein